MGQDIFQAQYEDLEEIARRFDQQAQESDQIRTYIQQKLDSLRNGGWEGMGSDAFYAEMEDQVMPALKRLSEAMAEGNYVTRQIMDMLQVAEEEAASTVQTEPDGGSAAATAVMGA
ncbi:MAG: WXG100 family type VII secretion target, partial [Anaerolineales bacterium]|nr:WXG100 family type VII secretion target [Anaerolineales bacterium]